MLTSPAGGSLSGPDGGAVFAALAPIGYGQSFSTMVASERLQPEQVLTYGQIGQTPLVLVLPNGAANYGAPLAKSVYEASQGWSATAQSVIRLGRARIVRDNSGGEALVIDVTPIKTVVSVNGKILAERSYENVPRLDAKSFTGSEPPSASRPHRQRADQARGRVHRPANGERCWRPPVVGGGGAYGRPAMAHRERTRLCRAAFLRGGQARTEPGGGGRPGAGFRPVGEGEYPALPFQVFATSPIELANNEKATSWGSLACFRGTFNSQMQEVNRGMAVGASVLDCARREAALTTSERRHCAAASAASRMMDFIRPFGGECRAASAPLNFSDPLNLGIRLSHDLPTPGVQILGGRATLMTTVTFTLTGVEISNRAPDMRNSLPESIKKEVGPAPPSDAKGEFVTLNAKFVEASYLDPQLIRQSPRSDPKAEWTSRGSSAITRRRPGRARSGRRRRRAPTAPISSGSGSA